MGLQHLPRLRGGLSPDDRVRRQDRRHAPAPGAGGGALSRKELTRIFKSMETQSNPWGIDAEKRFEWAERPRHSDRRRQARRRVPLLRRLRRRVRRSQQEDHAGVRAAAARRQASTSPASRAEEPCNGETARRLGNEYLYQAMAQMPSKPSTATKCARSS